MDPKDLAGHAALDYIKDGMIVGLGSGSTAKLFIDALGAALKEGRLKNITGIPTSVKSEQQARELGIPLTTFAQTPTVDVVIDGADEVDPHLNLIKGLGGALLREKLVAQNARRMIVVADTTKRVQVLGTHCPLPVEVCKFSHEASERFLRGLGCVPTLRRLAGGEPFVTDNGNFTYDCKFTKIDDPKGLEEKLAHRAGIVETGLFLGIADVALLAGTDSVETLKK